MVLSCREKLLHFSCQFHKDKKNNKSNFEINFNIKNMKKIIALAFFAVVAFAIKAQHITDFCYFDGQLLETYSDAEVVNNLRNRGFKVINKRSFRMEGAGGAMSTFYEYKLKMGNTIVEVGNGPSYIQFGSTTAARNFVTQAVNIGWFRRSGQWYEIVKEYAFGVDGLKLSGRKVSFSVSVP